jgi:hypothetical protein
MFGVLEGKIFQIAKLFVTTLISGFTYLALHPQANFSSSISSDPCPFLHELLFLGMISEDLWD